MLKKPNEMVVIYYSLIVRLVMWEILMIKKFMFMIALLGTVALLKSFEITS